MTDVYRCMIVTVAASAQAASIFAQLDGEAGTGMFVTELSATGLAPATHKISTGWVPESFAAFIDDAAVMYSLCQAQSIPMTLQDCTDLLAAMDVSSGSSWDAMTRMGLQMVTEEA